ncbi:hypothetical protein EJC49_07525 [Aquibium carbonis]|uniref:Uncharacterized protein n=1 Tax=Aquibium carbonis TaxID=2495581 RepID=A0A3R9YAY5_9HYPH|nr:hypothetical protein [Aquibium carbonis]RST87109.1 hypothetical protein EJC49_07525 [Aquibium carbonis]
MTGMIVTIQPIMGDPVRADPGSDRVLEAALVGGGGFVAKPDGSLLEHQREKSGPSLFSASSAPSTLPSSACGVAAQSDRTLPWR